MIGTLVMSVLTASEVLARGGAAGEAMKGVEQGDLDHDLRLILDGRVRDALPRLQPHGGSLREEVRILQCPTTGR
jgi:hypothetical protein